MKETLLIGLEDACLATPDGRTILKDAALTLRAGSRTALTGASGLGKTSVLSLIAGMSLPGFEASVLRTGALFEAGGPRLGTELLFLPQDALRSLEPLGRIEEQLLLTQRVREPSLTRAAAKAKSRPVLAELGFAEPDAVLAARPHALSGGMRQRVLGACALLLKPRVLLADEPASALDDANASRLMSALSRASEAFCFVTHDRRAAAAFADTVLTIRDGRFVPSDGAADVRCAVPSVSGKALGAPVLEMRNVTFERAKGRTLPGFARRVQTILKDFNLTIREGECVALLGPSGCGKTTAGELALGLLRAKAGEVAVLGRAPLAQAARYPGTLSWVGQNVRDALTPYWSVADLIAEPARIAGKSVDIEARLALVELTPDYATRKVASLSGGEAQRVALARAADPDVRFLVLDEALGALEKAQRERIGRSVVRAHSEKRATLLITHDEDEAERLADRIVRLGV